MYGRRLRKVKDALAGPPSQATRFPRIWTNASLRLQIDRCGAGLAHEASSRTPLA